MKKAVFFDIYSTMIDIRTDEYDPYVYSVLSRYLSYHSVKISPEGLKTFYFEMINQQMKQSAEVYPEVDVYDVFYAVMHKFGNRKYPQRVIEDISMLFRSLTIRHFGVFPGLYDVLVPICERYKTAIISDAQWVFTEAEIAILGLDQFFKTRILSSRYGFKKPDLRLFEMAMERLKVRPEESVYIGDNPRKDMIGAKRSGMKFILFRPSRQDFEGFRPDAYFHDYFELEKILDELI